MADKKEPGEAGSTPAPENTSKTLQDAPGGVVKAKRGRGHPSHYRPEFCEKLIELMAKGTTYEACAPELGVSRATLYNWEQQHPDFLEAKKSAVDRFLLYWENVLRGVITHDKQTVVESTLLIFFLKNRCGDLYRDVHRAEVKQESTVKVSGPTWLEVIEDAAKAGVGRPEHAQDGVTVAVTNGKDAKVS